MKLPCTVHTSFSHIPAHPLFYHQFTAYCGRRPGITLFRSKTGMFLYVRTVFLCRLEARFAVSSYCLTVDCSLLLGSSCHSHVTNSFHLFSRYSLVLYLYNVLLYFLLHYYLVSCIFNFFFLRLVFLLRICPDDQLGSLTSFSHFFILLCLFLHVTFLLLFFLLNRAFFSSFSRSYFSSFSFLTLPEAWLPKASSTASSRSRDKHMRIPIIIDTIPGV